MMLALPAAGALLGGALFSWGTTAMSVGWLVGSWLYGATSKATTPGINAKAMPTINMALRGSPLFMTFGTNRIGAQIVWTKNWHAERMKSSGKKGGGKGGGSGGGGAAKGGGSAATNYTYSMDMLFNFGMTDLPSFIKQGWVGGDAMSKDTVKALITAWPDAVSQIDAIFAANALVGSKDKPKATLDFSEAYFQPAEPTGDPDLDTWSYFQTQEGVSTAWPYTLSLGLKKLQLGPTGAIPQLSFECGPITTDFQTGYLGSHKAIDVDVQDQFWGGHTYVVANSKHWITTYVGISGNAFMLKAVEDNTVVTLSTTQFNIDSPIGAGWDVRYIFGIPGTRYIYVVMMDLGTNGFWIMIYRLNDDQTLTKVSATATVILMSGSPGPTLSGSSVVGVGVVHNQVYVASIGGYGLNTNRLSQIFQLGTLGTAPDGNTLAGQWESQVVLDITATLGDFFFYTIFASTRIDATAATFADDGGSSYKMLVYVGVPEIAHSSSSNTLITTLGATYPNGFMIDQGGNVLLGSFDDIGLHKDGSAGASYLSDYTTPNWVTSNGSQYLIFCRSYADLVDQTPHGNYNHVRVYDWNGTVGAEHFDYRGAVFDSITDLGVDNTVGPSTPHAVQLYMGDDGVIYGSAFYQGGGVSITQRYVNFKITPQSSAVEDVTPPYIIYRILTSDVFGFTTPLSRIDVPSYEAAVADCESKGILVSVTYTQSDNLLSVIDELLSLYGGYLTDDAGIITFGVVRTSDAPDPVVVDNTRLLSPGPGSPPVTVTRGAIQDGFNKIKFNYLDRNIDYKQNQIEMSDEVDMDINGIRYKEFPATYVMAGSLAQWEAERALWTNLYGRDTFAFKLGGKDAHRSPGDVITLVDSFHPILSSGVTARIMRIKESKRLEFDVQAVQVTDYHQSTNHDFIDTNSSVAANDLIQPAQAPLAQRAYETPREFQGSSGKVFLGYNQASAIMGAQLYLSFDAGASFVLAADVQPFIISGRLNRDLEMRQQGYQEDNVNLVLMPATSWSSATPTYVQTFNLDDVSEGIRASGGGVLVVGSEAIAMQDLTMTAQNQYIAKRMFRGWGGTPVSQHNSGEYWHYHSPGIFEIEITPDRIGTNVQFKIAPYNFAGTLFDVSSIAAGSYTIKGLYWLPRSQPKSRVWVQSGVSWPSSTALGDATALNVTSGGCALTLTWPGAAQFEGYGAGGFGANGYGHFTADILTPSYRVNVYSANGFNVRSTVVYTGYFNYDLATNSADFNGFAQNLWFRVTPYNSYGDGPWADNRTLSLFW